MSRRRKNRNKGGKNKNRVNNRTGTRPVRGNNNKPSKGNPDSRRFGGRSRPPELGGSGKDEEMQKIRSSQSNPGRGKNKNKQTDEDQLRALKASAGIRRGEFESKVSEPAESLPKINYRNKGGGVKAIKAYQDISNLANYEFALDESAREFETAYQTSQLQEQQAKDSYKTNMQIRDIQMNAQLQAYEDNQRFISQQLKFNEEGALRAEDDAKTVLGDRIKQVGFQEEELGYRRDEQAISTAAQLSSLDIQDFQAQQDKRLVDAQAERNQRLRDTAANLEQRQATFGADFEQEQQEAQTAFQLQQNRIEEAVNLGKSRAAGRVGTSANRAEQTVRALAGLNTSQLNDSLNRFTLKTGKEKGFIKERESLALKVNQADYTDATDRAKASENIALAKSSVDRERLTQLETVTNNRFEMQREELGETLLSALNGYEQSREQIYLDKFKADAQAYAQRMAKPQFADAPKAPYKIPKPKFISPPIPIEVPKGQVPKQPQQKTSIFGKVLQIGGMIASAVALPVTAGASAGTFSVLGASLAGGGALAQGIGGWI